MIAFASRWIQDLPIHDVGSHLDQNVQELDNAYQNDIVNNFPLEVIQRSYVDDRTSSLAYSTINRDGFTM